MNGLIKTFEGTQIEIITDETGDMLFELYSTGMAIGQTKESKGVLYPRKDRIEQNVKNADIQPVVRNGQQYLTEEMLYDFMLEAKTEKCKPFRKWLTTEVLPNIRKHGAYMTDNTIQKALTDPDFLIQLATNLKEEKQKRIEVEKQLEEQKPKVDFVDHISTSENSLLVREVAKIVSKRGIKIGERKLYEKLRGWGFVFKNTCEATQKAIEQGILEIVEGAKENSKGTFTFKTTKVTGKGQVYIINRLIKEGF